jgi:transketolase
MMQKLAAVEEAKALFEEAKEWGVWRWLTEKPKVRQAADAAWEALDKREKKVRAEWSADTRHAYKADPDLQQALAEVNQAHLSAEAQFEEAERRMSIAMAREGAQMAIDSWTLREKFIRKLEALGRK